jgi:23S rRNA (pseudouridine1915-N3)-methyltransferase
VKITLLLVGKTTESYLNQAIEEYLKRLRRYVVFEICVIPELKNAKNMSFDLQKEREGVAILNAVEPSDDVVLLDEKGAQYSSVEFASLLEKKSLSSVKRLVFVVGGPYGFSEDVYSRANGRLSLSRMTFSHQMIRLLFVEQVYRAMTILKGEPYHHE